MPNKPSPEDILLAQSEHYRTEWRPENILLAGSAIRKCEFESLRRGAWKISFDSGVLAPQRLLEPSYFPAIDPVTGEYGHGERPIDVLFVGGYSRHHFACAKIIEQVASIAYARQVVYCLGESRLVIFCSFEGVAAQARSLKSPAFDFRTSAL